MIFSVLVSPLNFCRKGRNFGNRVSIHVEIFRFSFMDWWKSRTFFFVFVCVCGGVRGCGCLGVDGIVLSPMSMRVEI